MSHKHLILICLFLFLANSVLAAKTKTRKEKFLLTATAKVDKKSVSIGDKIKYTVTVKSKKNIDLKFPNFAQSFKEKLASFAIRDFGSARKNFFGKKKVTQWYLLDTYNTGKYTIPPARIQYKEKNKKEWQNLKTNAVKIEVKTLLGKAGKTTDIRDIKGPVNFAHKIVFYLFSALLLLFVILGIWGRLFLLKRKQRENFIPPRPAHEIADEALEKLLRKEYAKAGKIKEYYGELSLIVRRYLEDRFNLRAPEMTTEEFLLKAKDTRELSSAHKTLLKEFLAHCDLVKFARYGPSENEIGASFQSAKKLIAQTKKGEEIKKLTK